MLVGEADVVDLYPIRRRGRHRLDRFLHLRVRRMKIPKTTRLCQIHPRDKKKAPHLHAVLV